MSTTRIKQKIKAELYHDISVLRDDNVQIENDSVNAAMQGFKKIYQELEQAEESTILYHGESIVLKTYHYEENFWIQQAVLRRGSDFRKSLIRAPYHEFVIGNQLGNGGYKSIYKISQDEVIAIRNFHTDTIDIQSTSRWCQAVDEEVEVASYLSSLGLLAIDCKRDTIYKDGHPIPVLKMTNFENIKGEIQDVKWKELSYGKTLFFSYQDKPDDPKYLKILLKDILQDIVTLIVNDVDLRVETCNFIVTGQVENQDEFHAFDPDLQKIRLFFVDFARKDQVVSIRSEINLWNNDQLNKDIIFQKAKEYLKIIISNFLHLKLSDTKAGCHPYVLADMIRKSFESIAANLTEEIVSEVIYRLQSSVNNHEDSSELRPAIHKPR